MSQTNKVGLPSPTSSDDPIVPSLVAGDFANEAVGLASDAKTQFDDFVTHADINKDHIIDQSEKDSYIAAHQGFSQEAKKLIDKAFTKSTMTPRAVYVGAQD